MKRKMLVLVLLTALGNVLFGGGAEEVPMDSAGALRIGLIITHSGLGDNNFNDMGYQGLKRAEEELGIVFDYGEPATVSDYETQQRSFASAGIYDLIVTIGADQAESLKIVAQDFPDQSFTIVDGSLDSPNVHSIFTRFEDQTFLTGVLAGLMTNRDDFPMVKPQHKKIGIIRGMDLPILRNATSGYEAGARYIDPDIQVLVGDVGSFNDPGKAKEMALTMYGKGVDFVQLMAGGSGLGIINAAVEAEAYAFGVGANQNALQPDYVAATAIRNVDEIIFNDIKNYQENNWKPGMDVWGIKESAVGYSTEGSAVQLPRDVVETIESIREALVQGDIVPPDHNQDMEDWVSKNKYQ